MGAPWETTQRNVKTGATSLSEVAVFSESNEWVDKIEGGRERQQEKRAGFWRQQVKGPPRDSSLFGSAKPAPGVQAQPESISPTSSSFHQSAHTHVVLAWLQLHANIPPLPSPHWYKWPLWRCFSAPALTSAQPQHPRVEASWWLSIPHPQRAGWSAFPGDQE